MSKAQTIDRLEFTRRRFAKQLGLDDTASEAKHEEHYGVSRCPMCGQMTLIHEGGCSRCPSCGWSACG